MLIGISGYAGSGKDTVARMILQSKFKGITKKAAEYWTPSQYGNITAATGWKVKKFAGNLKQIASMLTGIPVEKFEDQDFKAQVMGKEWNQWVVEWKSGDDGPGKEFFQTRSEAINFVEDHFEEPEDIIDDPKYFRYEEMTYREFLRRIGNYAMRDVVHKQIWINALMSEYKEGENWVVSDVRFPNEASAIKDKGGIIIRVNRKIPFDNVPSEVSLDKWDFDVVIENDGTIEELTEKVKWIVDNYNL